MKPKTPTLIRRSLRTQGKVPDSTGLKHQFRTQSKPDQILISQLKNSDVHGRVKASIDLDSMKLEPKNIANLLPRMIRSIKFVPATNMRMVVVGNKWGTIGFWNVDSEMEDSDGIYKYHTNPGCVSAILIQPFSTNKVILWFKI